MKFWKIINTNTKQEVFAKAVSIDHVALYIIKNMSADWYYGANIVEVNENKETKRGNDFMMIPVRDYFVMTMKTEDDKWILRTAYNSHLYAIRRTA